MLWVSRENSRDDYHRELVHPFYAVGPLVCYFQATFCPVPELTKLWFIIPEYFI